MTTTHTDPAGHHDWTSQEYVDDWIARDVMNDDERRPVLNSLARRLPIDPEGPSRILDVGAGYGIVSGEILGVLPNAHVVLQDVSQAMLGHTQARLNSFGDRMSLVVADFRDEAWTEQLGGPFDAVVSSLAIHNVRHFDQIRRVYSDIFNVLTPGGCFFNMDLIAGDGPKATAALGLGQMPTAAGEEDRPDMASLVVQLGWLRDIGFAEVDCLYREGAQTLLAGFR